MSSGNTSMVSAAADDDLPSIPTTGVAWHPSFRLIPSRFPTVGLFDRVADARDLDAIYAIEALTNDRIRDEAGTLALVPPDERIAGPGSTPIMAAFTHLNPEGSRFSDGTFGVYYCSRSLDTALAEVRFHQEQFLRATRQEPIRLELRLYRANLDASLGDVRRMPRYHSPDDYSEGRRLGAKLRAAGSDGVLYRSVRHEGGLCAAVFRPKVLSHCRQSTHYAFRYDGTRIDAIEAISRVWTAEPLQPPLVK
jgi:hypothetical protein